MNDGMRCWVPVVKGEIVADVLYGISRRRKTVDQLIDFDLFAEPDAVVDVVLAVVCSCGPVRFFYRRANAKKRAAYMRRLTTRGKAAARAYEVRMRGHFRTCKMFFREGYSLPEPPTGEVRAIYDSAAAWENRPTNPSGTTLHSGWSLGEYHWRGWPLGNLIDLESDWDKVRE